MNSKLTILKEDLKELAKSIRLGKSVRKPKYLQQFPERLVYLTNLSYNRYHYRHLHIAYCLLRGKSMSQIENPPFWNQPDINKINNIMRSYDAEIIRSCS